MTQDTKVDWGPEIRVDGKRPEWLPVGQEFHAGGGGYDWFGVLSRGQPHVWNRAPNTEPAWGGVDHIRLPADHPHYAEVPANPQAPTLPDDLTARMVGIPQELAQRMAKVIRILADSTPCGDNEAEEKLIAVAQAIRADLPPEPVDPDLLAAREIGRAGCYDHDSLGEQLLVEAIKRGRALAEAGK